MVVEGQARMLMATLHGLMVQWHRLPGSVDWRAIAAEIIRGLHTSSCFVSPDTRNQFQFVEKGFVG